MSYTDTGACGAAGELLASAHFLSQGYYVFRSQSQHSPFDLVIYRDGQCQRVEVKYATVLVSHTGRKYLSYSKPRNREWDLLAVVLNQQVHTFEPDEIDDLHSHLRSVIMLDSPVST